MAITEVEITMVEITMVEITEVAIGQHLLRMIPLGIGVITVLHTRMTEEGMMTEEDRVNMKL